MNATSRRAAAAAALAGTAGPQVSVPVFVQAMTRAGRRCECTRRGCHGRSGRCERSHLGSRLVVAPRDASVPAQSVWRVPVADLAVWCPRCHAIAVCDGTRARAELARQAHDVLPLALPGGPCELLEVN